MRPITKLIAAAGLVLAGMATPLMAQTLRIGMTTTDVPTTGGIPDNGSEGGRFAGYTIYDALVNWDFKHPDTPSDVVPGLATDWHVDPKDPQTWIFTLRQGVKFHDGSTFTADDVIWNLDRHLNQSSPQYDKVAAPSYSTYTRQIDKYYKIDATHVAIHTKVPFSPFLYSLARIFIVSPTQFKNVGSNWLAFIAHPSGTGPFKVDKVTPHVSIELSRNDDYWDKTRIPKIAKLVLLPIPDSVTRVAALRSNQVDWVEYPDPDSIDSLKADGFQIYTKPYPHIWAWIIDNSPDSPLHDKRLRMALNFAVDRPSMVEMLAGTATPATGFYGEEDTKHFGKPTVHFNYDPDKARALMKEAGYGPDHRLKLRVQVPTAGSGNMVPLPMSQLVQQNLRDIWVDVDYEVVDWGTMITTGRILPGTPGAPHRDAINHGLPLADPTAIYNSFTTDGMQSGSNWGMYQNPQVDKLLADAFATFDPDKRDALIAQAHAIIVDDAAWLFVVHDLNPRALSPKVKGFVQAESWYQDLTQLTVTP